MKNITYDDTLYQLVPKEPTREMLISGMDQGDGGGYDMEGPEPIYKAMLSAAPQPEANEPDQCRAKQVDGKWLCDCTCMYTKCKPVQDAIRFGKDSSIEPHLDGDIGHE